MRLDSEICREITRSQASDLAGLWDTDNAAPLRNTPRPPTRCASEEGPTESRPIQVRDRRGRIPPPRFAQERRMRDGLETPGSLLGDPQTTVPGSIHGRGNPKPETESARFPAIWSILPCTDNDIMVYIYMINIAASPGIQGRKPRMG